MIVNGVHLQTPIKLIEQTTVYGRIIQRGYPIVQEIQVMGQFFLIEFHPHGLVKIDGRWTEVMAREYKWLIHGDKWSLYVKVSHTSSYLPDWKKNYRWGTEGVFKYEAHKFQGDAGEFQNSMFYIKMIEDQNDWEEYLY